MHKAFDEEVTKFKCVCGFKKNVEKALQTTEKLSLKRFLIYQHIIQNFDKGTQFVYVFVPIIFQGRWFHSSLIHFACDLDRVSKEI